MPSIRRNIRFTPAATSAEPGRDAVLLLDDDVRIHTLLSGALSSVLGGIPLLKALTIKEALAIASTHSIKLFIVDVDLPDGTGLDFHRQVRDQHRAAHTIVITGTPLIVDENFSQRFGTDHVLRKPFNIVELQTIVKDLLSKPRVAAATAMEPPSDPTDSVAPSDDTFAATLHSLTPTDIIQLKCIGRATSALRFTATDGRTGHIHFLNGDIVHAETARRHGIDAFNEIVTWRGGRVAETAVVPVERSIQGKWEGLLMDALRLADEAATS